MLFEKKSVALEFFNSPESLQIQSEWDDNTFFLVDFDFAESAFNGIELIQKMGIENRSILVSGRWNDPEISLSCELLGIQRFPKEMLGLLPILNQEHEKASHALNRV